MDSIANSVAKFSVRFVYELDKGTSVVASPLSCEILLALLTLGSTDPAHQELTNAIGISSDEEIRKSFKSVTSSIKAIKGVNLNVANKIFIKDGNYTLQPNLSKDAVDVFDAALEKVNFNHATEAVKTINDWVEKKTEHKIKDLLTTDAINGDTRLVLVNAIYFKGLWKTKFNERNTQDRDFFVTASKKIQVPMMSQEANFKYFHDETLGAQILEMPYVGGDASMVIILPTEIEGLNDVMTKLANGHDLMATFKNLKNEKVNVVMPKFKIETTIDLIPILTKLGMSSLFQTHSGLTKLLDNAEPLAVSGAIQKAFIEVNEEGTEAAAATESDKVVTVENTTPEHADVPGCSYWSDVQYSDVEQPTEEAGVLVERLPPTTSAAAATTLVAPPLVTTATTPTTAVSQNNDLNTPTEQVPELYPDLLEILGQDPASIKEYGDNIQKDLAIRLNHIVTSGLSKENRKELKDKYLIPDNCKLIKAPTLNDEIKASLIESQAKRDKGIEIKQQMTACGLSALSAAITLLLSSNNKNPELLKLLMDSARIFGDIQHTDSMTRRFFVLSTIKKELKDQLEKTKIDEMLFGSNLAERLKSAKFINKSGADIRSASTIKSTVQRPATKPQMRSLNFKAPPATRRPPPGGARVPQAAHPVPTLRKPMPMLPTQHNATRQSSRRPQASFRR